MSGIKEQYLHSASLYDIKCLSDFFTKMLLGRGEEGTEKASLALLPL